MIKNNQQNKSMNESYENLAVAIIALSIIDIKVAKKRKKEANEKPLIANNDKQINKLMNVVTTCNATISNCKRFFRSDWCHELLNYLTDHEIEYFMK